MALAAAVVRTSLLIGDERSKQVRLCLDARTGDAGIRLFRDEVRCPIAMDDLAAAVLELVESDVAGLLHVAGPQAVSRVELGELVARRYGFDPGRVPAGTMAESGLIRPGEARLDSARAARLLKMRLRPVGEVLAAA
jgi:dTDP-4-dehydrorhamnose reductase